MARSLKKGDPVFVKGRAWGTYAHQAEVYFLDGQPVHRAYVTNGICLGYRRSELQRGVYTFHGPVINDD